MDQRRRRAPIAVTRGSLRSLKRMPSWSLLASNSALRRSASSKRCQAFESAGVCLALENYEGNTSGELAALVRDAASPCLGICLDTVNSLGAMETPAMVVAALAPYVHSLHIKDFDIARAESRMGYVVSGRPAGEGLLDIDWLLAEIRRAGPEPNLILELWTPYQGTVEETIRLEAEWADRSIRFLKRYAC